MSPITIKAHENPKLTALIIRKIIPMAINMIPRVLIAFLHFLSYILILSLDSVLQLKNLLKL